MREHMAAHANELQASVKTWLAKLSGSSPEKVALRYSFKYDPLLLNVHKTELCRNDIPCTT